MQACFWSVAGNGVVSLESFYVSSSVSENAAGSLEEVDTCAFLTS